MAEFSQFTITDAAYEAATRFVEEKWFDSANEATDYQSSTLKRLCRRYSVLEVA